MSRSLLAASVLVLACVVSAEQLLGRAEPIPSDKCGSSVISFDDERLYVFALSEDSVVWHKYQQKDGVWSTWRSLADRKKMGSGPKAVRYPNGTVQVFARGTDRKIYVSTMESETKFSNWTTPFGDRTFLSAPVPVVAPCGSVYVFAVDAVTHTVWYSVSTPITSSELTFSEWADLGGDATSAPAVIVDGEGLIHVFIRGTNRALWHRAEVYPRVPHVSNTTKKEWMDDWECLGGVMASSPKIPVTLNGASLVEVYGRAADKALWHRKQEATFNASSVEWSEWKSLGGVLASAPSVALKENGLVDVFVRATDKAIYFKEQFEDNDVVHFSKWATLGGMFSTTPEVVVRADGLIDVFARGIDKALWHTHQFETNGTREFTSWHSLGGHTRKYAC